MSQPSHQHPSKRSFYGFIEGIARPIAALIRWRWLNRARPYNRERFEKRRKYLADYEVFSESLLQRIEWNSVMDIGCANGFLLDSFSKKNKKVHGIEVSEDAKAVLPDTLRSVVTFTDFSQADGKWDLVLCVEVAEHIPSFRSHELVKKLTSLATKFIVFTAAPPWQPGYGHINCRPHSDWIQWFQENGWETSPALTDLVRQDLKKLKKAIWLRHNIFVFVPKK